MRISATGKAEQAAGAARPDAGFTLLELLIVMAIVATLATMMVLQFRPPGAAGPEGTLRDLAHLIGIAGDEAIFNRRDFALDFSPEGVSLLVYNARDEAWGPVTAPATLAAEIPFGRMKPELVIEGRNAMISESREPSPDAFVLSSGETTPLTLSLSDGRATAKLSVDPYGKVQLGDPEPR